MSVYGTHQHVSIEDQTSSLHFLYIGGSGTLLPFSHVKLQLISFHQSVKVDILELIPMKKYLSAILRGDESEAALSDYPLYLTFGHLLLLSRELNLGFKK
jgi:hypothetical protein